jgi:serine/threonine-protein kinase
MADPEEQIYLFGDFRLNTSKHLLYNGLGKAVPLMPKAFDTLRYLVENRGKVIEKDELMRKIWPDTSVEENNLTQNISILRRIFGEKPGEHRFIVTVPGRGYKFVADVTEIDPDRASAAPPQDIISALDDDPSDEDISLPTDAPQGLESKEHRVNDINQPAAQERTNRFWLFTIFGICVAAFGVLGFYWWGGDAAFEKTPIQSVAVLPFKPLAPESRNEALELGMAETLISKLSGGDITVRPLSAIRRYNSVEQDSSAAGRELNVDAVLDGTIQTSGDRIRVSAKLVRVGDGKQLWSQRYDEKFTDIFALQDSISQRVASALEITLGGRNPEKSTNSVEAYQLYMKGNYHASRLVLPEVQKGISYYEQAIAVDPSYARAYVGLANAYRAMLLTNDARPGDVIPKAKAACFKAVELDNSLADAYTGLAAIAFWYDWDMKTAVKHHLKALELDPESAHARFLYAHMLSNTGRHDEALAEIKRAKQSDPVSLIINAGEGLFLSHAGRNEEALKILQTTAEMEPNFWLAHLFMSNVYLRKEMYDEAIAAASRARDITHGNSEAISTIGYAFARSGRIQEARGVLNELEARAANRYVPSYTLSQIYNALGEKEKSLSLLEKAFDDKDALMVFLKVDSKWDNLRSEPRFVDLVKRMGFEQ